MVSFLDRKGDFIETTPPRKSNWLSRKWIVIPKLQNEILVVSGLSASVIMILFLTSQAYTYDQFGNLALDANSGLGAAGLVEFREQVIVQLWLMVICGFTAISFGLIYGLILSNRIAGPLYRLNNHLDQLIEGKNVPDIHFRSKDYLKDTSDKINLISRNMKQSSEKAK